MSGNIKTVVLTHTPVDEQVGEFITKLFPDQSYILLVYGPRFIDTKFELFSDKQDQPGRLIRNLELAVAALEKYSTEHN